MSRVAVVQPPSLNGFSVINVKLKVSSLLGQCITGFAVTLSRCNLLMSYWFFSCFGVSPSVVLARPHSVGHRILLRFYCSLLLA